MRKILLKIHNSSFIFRAIWVKVSIFLLISFIQLVAFAEVQHEVYEVKFNVEELQKIDSSSYEIKLTRDSEKLIIPNTSLATYLAEYFFFGEQATNYKIIDILRFTNNASIQEDFSGFELVIRALVNSSYDFLEKDDEIEPQIKLFTAAVKKNNKLNSNVITNKSLLFKISLELIDNSIYSEGRVLSEELLSDLNRFIINEETLIESVGNCVKDVLKEKLSLNLVAEAKNFIKQVLPIYKHLSKETSKLIALETIITRIHEISPSAEEDTLNSIAKELKDNYLEISDVLSVFYDNKLKDITSKQIESNNYLGAVKTILSSDFDRRTPATHEHLEKSLTRISEEESLELTGDESKLSALILFATKDVKLRNLIFEKIFRNIYHKISLDKLYDAEIMYSSLSRALKDSQLLKEGYIIEKLDQLKINFSRSYLRKGDLKHAEEKVKELSQNNDLPNTIIRLSIKYHSFGKFKYVFIILPIIFLCLLTYTCMKKGRRTKKIQNTILHGNDSLETDDQGFTRTYEKKLFVNPVARKTNPLIQEYLDCISAINVKAGATEKEIKIAFRNRAKVLHPDDAGSNPRDIDSNDFLELQKKYNRLLELERQYSFSIQDFFKDN